MHGNKGDKIHIFTTGGTIDKTYFDAKSEYEVGDPQIGHILQEAGVTFKYEITPLFRKDSLEIDAEDREEIRRQVAGSDAKCILITHGTDTMAQTAAALKGISDKTIVLTGALNPARFSSSDAIFNIGCAVAAVQAMPAGVYIAMNGRIFDAMRVRKNRSKNRFEDTLE